MVMSQACEIHRLLVYKSAAAATPSLDNLPHWHWHWHWDLPYWHWQWDQSPSSMPVLIGAPDTAFPRFKNVMKGFCWRVPSLLRLVSRVQHGTVIKLWVVQGFKCSSTVLLLQSAVHHAEC